MILQVLDQAHLMMVRHRPTSQVFDLIDLMGATEVDTSGVGFSLADNGVTKIGTSAARWIRFIC